MVRVLRGVIAAVGVAAAFAATSPGPAAAMNVSGVGVPASGVQMLKNSDCGWTIKTKYHSCALAYSLVMEWLVVGELDGREDQDSLDRVFSPNSGKRYNFQCAGVNRVTCKSNKGTVTFQPAKLPPERDCYEDNPDESGNAWLSSSCELARATVTAEQADKGLPAQISVVDPTNGRTYQMTCFGVHDGDLVMCLNGKRAVTRATW